jgi:hypothetical protein
MESPLARRVAHIRARKAEQLLLARGGQGGVFPHGVKEVFPRPRERRRLARTVLRAYDEPRGERQVRRHGLVLLLECGGEVGDDTNWDR